MFNPKYIFIVIIAAAVLIAYFILTFSAVLYFQQSEPVEKVVIQNNSFVAISAVYYPQPKVYASLSNESERIIQCESGGIHEQWGDLDKKYPVYGIAQFQERTFYWLADLVGKELDWKNEQDQRWLLEWALENGYGYLWSCYKRL